MMQIFYMSVAERYLLLLLGTHDAKQSSSIVCKELLWLLLNILMYTFVICARWVNKNVSHFYLHPFERTHKFLNH